MELRAPLHMDNRIPGQDQHRFGKVRLHQNRPGRDGYIARIVPCFVLDGVSAWDGGVGSRQVGRPQPFLERMAWVDEGEGFRPGALRGLELDVPIIRPGE